MTRRKREEEDDTTPSGSRQRVSRQQGKLNSNLFQLYFENLWRSFSQDKRASFTCLDSLWFSLYTEPTYKVKVLKWITKKQFFTKKYVFVPIVQWRHWCLLIFCNFDESLQSKTSTPCMLLLDSLQMAGSKRFEPAIRKFLFDIYKAEERPENKQQISQIPFLVPKVPQQRNGKECGKFVLYFFSLFMKSAPKNFSINEGYPYFMKEDWFGPEDYNRFCEELNSYGERNPDSE